MHHLASDVHMFVRSRRGFHRLVELPVELAGDIAVKAAADFPWDLALLGAPAYPPKTWLPSARRFPEIPGVGWVGDPNRGRPPPDLSRVHVIRNVAGSRGVLNELEMPRCIWPSDHQQRMPALCGSIGAEQDLKAQAVNPEPLGRPQVAA